MELYARPLTNLDDNIVEERERLQRMAEGICPSGDVSFAQATVAELSAGNISIRPQDPFIVYYIRAQNTDVEYLDRNLVHRSRLAPIESLAGTRLVDLRHVAGRSGFETRFAAGELNFMPSFTAEQWLDRTQLAPSTPSLQAILRDADQRRAAFGYTDVWPPLILMTTDWSIRECNLMLGEIARAAAQSNVAMSGMHLLLLNDITVNAGDPDLRNPSIQQTCRSTDSDLSATVIQTWFEGLAHETGRITNFDAIYGGAVGQIINRQVN